MPLNCNAKMLCCYPAIMERLVQVTELQEENCSIRKQLDTLQSATDQDITAGTENAGKVDRNANLPVTCLSDELLAADTNKPENLEAAEQQVLTCYILKIGITSIVG